MGIRWLFLFPSRARYLDALTPRGRTPSSSPEHTPYRDTGCDIAPACLTCPLMRCRYDEPGGLVALRRLAQDARVLELVRERKTVGQIAEATGLSVRTVQRVLRRNGL